MKYLFDNNYYLIRLNKEEEIVQTLEYFFEKQGINAGTITGIGAVKNVSLDFYHPHKQEYSQQFFDDNFEIINFMGNISLKDGSPFLHAHMAIGNSSFQVIGGHLFSAVVSITGEFTVTPFSKPIHRKHDEETGLKLLDL